MTRGIYTSKIILKLESPFLSAGLAAPAFGIDVAQLTNHLGNVIFPYGQIRGVIRNALHELVGHGVTGAGDVLSMFGKPGVGDADQGNIRFLDCVCREKADPAQQTRIAIDEMSGAVDHGHMLVLQTAFPMNMEVSFEGKVEFAAKDVDAAKTICNWLGKAGKLVHAIGAFKNAGFGRVLDFSFAEPQLVRVTTPEGTTPTVGNARAYRLTMELDGPLLADTIRPEHNFLKSSDTINGAAWKGAVARMIAHGNNTTGPVTGAFGDALTRMQFTHSTATEPDLPLSLLQVAEPKDKLSRANAINGAELSPADFQPAGKLRKSMLARPPAFFHDFKDSWISDQTPRQEVLPRETRTRLAINYDSGAAEEGQLFSTETIQKSSSDGEPVRWTCRIGWPEQGEPPQEFHEIVGYIEKGIHWIGKLNTAAKITKCEALGEPKLEDFCDDNGRVAIILESPHAMVEPAALESEADMEKAIAAYFSLLKIARQNGTACYFACQELRGGFQLTRSITPGSKISPTVLMSAGSVFVFDTDGEKSQLELLSAWAKRGLPDRGTSDGDDNPFSNPFTRRNGYGRIRLCKPSQINSVIAFEKDTSR